MNNFQIVIIDHSTGKQVNKDKKGEKFATQQHSRTGDKLVNSIKDLNDVWEDVVGSLTALATKTQEVGARATSKFELNSIEFNIGIEAGISVGLVTKGDASVSLTFSRKSESKNL